MILTNILYRTFFIKAAQYGTAFTVDVEGVEYLVAACLPDHVRRRDVTVRPHRLESYDQLTEVDNDNE